ncbi:DUF3078 domain-containing protein [Chryseobacterium sp.]|uniref:DUF3078 domain-containing protein n=1 Tax=Chryseobacterium sp. TaxID=1871047 RepID=UPI0012A9BB96|nr:DUF3078 domain-containing protein [Chryseobacterium sp.]QFG52044.1 DUF3078 domain-containing protein [Chryseobacterium sp.]
MKRILLLLPLLVYTSGFGQTERDSRSVVDSIQYGRWKSTLPNLDSLANPIVMDLEPKFRDTIIVRDEIIIPQVLEEVPITPFALNNLSAERKWYFYGQNNLVFNQASFSNWNSGGNNSIGAIGKMNYNLSYKNKKHYLENIMQLGFGWNAAEGQSSRKTEDFINFMSNYGYDLGKHYYLSTGFQLITQFAPGFNYSEVPDPSFADRISRFMAPGYVNAGIGFSYNPSENFQVILRPANGKFTFVTDPLLQKAGRYGLERDGQSVRSELGAMMNILYRLKILQDVNLDNQLNFFSNYISHPERVDVAYNGVLNIKLNRFISTLVSLELAYDHDQIQKLQRKQTLGIGFSYNIGEQATEKLRTKKAIKPFITK